MFIPPAHLRQNAFSASPVRFGKMMNIVWDTAECEPARTGGLGVVSKSILEALIREQGDRFDIRSVLPGLPAILKDEPPFRQTGWAIKLNVPENGNKPETFKVLERFLPLPEDMHKPPKEQRGHWQYAIDNKTYFDAKDLYTYSPQATGGQNRKDERLLNLDPSFAKNMIRTKVAARVIKGLEAGKTPPGARLNSFDGPIHAIIANDWMSGPLFRELAALKSNDPTFNPTKIFYVHNNHSSDRLISQAKKLGMNLPMEPALLYPPGTESKKRVSGPQDGIYSPLALGLHDADLIIGNKNYIKTLTQTSFAKGHAFRDILVQKATESLQKDKLQQNGSSSRIQDMHHAPADKFNPQTNPNLKIDGFHPLAPSDTGMIAFKKANKAALQNALGLKKDDKAVVMTWMARLEPRQKGFNLLRDSIKELMAKHPHLQLVIWGEADKNDKVQLAAIEQLQKDPDLKGRLYLPNRFAKGKDEKRIVQSYAGSDFVILPSMWEPYGLTQLEATVMGAIPLVHGVDGIRSTVSDPTIPAQQEAAQSGRDTEKVWEYGQTGVMMEPVPVTDYLRALDRTKDLETLSQRIVTALEPKSTDKLTIEGLKGIAKQIEKAITPTEDDKGQTSFNAEERAKLRQILSHRLFVKALKADTLQPAEIKRILSNNDLSALQSDVKTLQTLFKAKDQAVLDAARKHFTDAMDRAMTLAEQQPAKMAEVRQNGRRYVAENHSEKAVINRFYLPTLEKAQNLWNQRKQAQPVAVLRSKL